MAIDYEVKMLIGDIELPGCLFLSDFSFFKYIGLEVGYVFHGEQS